MKEGTPNGDVTFKKDWEVMCLPVESTGLLKLTYLNVLLNNLYITRGPSYTPIHHPYSTCYLLRTGYLPLVTLIFRIVVDSFPSLEGTTSNP